MHTRPERYSFTLNLLTTAVLIILGGGPAWAFLSPPTIASGGVRNAADYSTNIAPGSIIAIFGKDLASKTTMASSLPLPLALGDVKVLINDGSFKRQAALAFVSEGADRRRGHRLRAGLGRDPRRHPQADRHGCDRSGR